MTTTEPPDVFEEAFKETFLVYFNREEIAALNVLGRMLFRYILEFREPGPDPELRASLREWRAVGRELRHLERYLEELASSFEETDGPERERSDELVARARRRASELEQLAMRFEDDIKGESSE
jgi:cell division septum initiation protein DivIVA